MSNLVCFDYVWLIERQIVLQNFNNDFHYYVFGTFLIWQTALIAVFYICSWGFDCPFETTFSPSKCEKCHLSPLNHDLRNLGQKNVNVVEGKIATVQVPSLKRKINQKHGLRFMRTVLFCCMLIVFCIKPLYIAIFLHFTSVVHSVYFLLTIPHFS